MSHMSDISLKIEREKKENQNSKWIDRFIYNWKKSPFNESLIAGLFIIGIVMFIYVIFRFAQ